MRSPRPLVAVIGLAAIVVLAGSIATIAVRAGSSGTSHPAAKVASPAAVTAAYYEDLHEQDASAAFALLCPAQQTEGEGAFAQSVGQDASTGTGITSFVPAGATTITGESATVPGAVTLDDGQSVPIHVLLSYAGASWQVCSSDLGGVLPGPGASAAPSSAV